MVFILNESNHDAVLASIFSSGKISDYFTCRVALPSVYHIKETVGATQVIQKEQDHLLAWLSPYSQIKEVHHHTPLRGSRVALQGTHGWYAVWLTAPSVEGNVVLSKAEIIYRDDQQCLICCHKYPNYISHCHHAVYCRDCVTKWHHDHPQKDLTCAECWKVL